MKSTRFLASALVLVMVGPTVIIADSASAFHVPERDFPDAPLLEYDQKTCLASRFSQYPGEFQNIRDQRTFMDWVAYDGKRVPALCVAAGDTAGTALLERANLVVDQVNEVIQFLENQTAYRQEIYSPLNRTPFLQDDFEGRRVGGYGDWSVVTVAGKDGHNAPAAFHHGERTERFEDPDAGMHFFDPATGYYPRAADVALVSPEIDLFSADVPGGAGDRECYAMSTLFCAHYIRGPREMLELLTPTEAMRDAALAIAAPLINGWEQQQTATMQIRHRYNLALGLDGVRYELYLSEPTKADLEKTSRFGADEDEGRFVLRPTLPGCGAAAERQGTQYSLPRNADNAPTGCVPIMHPQPRGTGSVAAQQNTPLTGPSPDQYAPRVASFNSNASFTGSSQAQWANPDTGWMNATFDLSRFVGQSVWIVAHARSTLALADDYFTSDQNFPQKGGYGYFLESVNLTAKAKLHNLRVKGTDGAGLTRIADLAHPDLPYKNPDTNRTEQTILPPGVGESVGFYVTNFGRVEDTAHVTINVDRRRSIGGQPVITESTLSLTKTLRPGEVWVPEYPFPNGVHDGEKITFNVSAVLLDNEGANAGGGADGVHPGAPTRFDDDALQADPFQPRNEQYYRVDADNTATADVYARFVRALVLEPPVLGAANLVAIEPAIEAKDEPRTVSVRVRNAGNAAESVRVVPSLTDGERQFPDFFVGEAARDIGVLAPEESVDLSWELRPYLTGTFELAFTFIAADDPSGLVIGQSPVRVLYVGRTAGVVCGDDLSYRRACTNNWALDSVNTMRGRDLNAVWEAPSGELWIAADKGGAFRGKDGAYLDLRDGTAVQNPLPTTSTRNAALSSIAFRGVWGRSDADVWLVGDNASVLHFDGTWVDVPLTDSRVAGSTGINPLEGRRFTAVSGTATETFVAATGGYLLRYNATSKALENIPAVGGNAWSPRSVYTLNAFAPGPGGLWAVGDNGVIERFDGTRWNSTRPGTSAPYGPNQGTGAHLFAVSAVDDRYMVAGGDGGIIYTFDAQRAVWTLNRTATPGTGAITSFAVTSDGKLWALGENGLLLRCEGCLAGGAWVAALSPVPFAPRSDQTPRLTGGTHLTTGGYISGQPAADDRFVFQVTYADPEGRRPAAIMVHVNDLSSEGAVPYPLTWTGAGSHTTGALYSTAVTLPAGRYQYYFTASDGTFTVATPLPSEAPALMNRFGVGGDCKTGADAVSTVSLASANRIYPDHRDVVCSGVLVSTAGDLPETSDTADAYRVRVAAGQTLSATATAVGSTPVTFQVRLLTSSGAALANGPGSASSPVVTTNDYFVAITRSEQSSAIPNAQYNLQVTVTPASLSAPALNALGTSVSSPQNTELPARVRAALTTAEGTAMALVEGGFLLRYVEGPVFENFGEWNPDYRLEPAGTAAAGRWAGHNVAWWGGGYLGSYGSLRAAPVGAMTDSGALLDTSTLRPGDWSELNLVVSHHVARAYGANRGTTADPVYDAPEIRLSFTATPERKGSGSGSCRQGTALATYPTDLACGALSVPIATYHKPHEYEGWTEEKLDVLAVLNENPWLRPDTRFAGIDFYIPARPTTNDHVRTPQWGIDSIRLEGVTSAGAKVVLVDWQGRDRVGYTRPYFVQENDAINGATPLEGTQWLTPWAIHPRPVTGHLGDPAANDAGTRTEGKSLWHKSKETDAAVWVANDAEQRLGPYTVGSQSILVTPAVDLRQVFDPVLEFRHAFALRARPVAGCLKVYDVASVWMQKFDAESGRWERLERLTPEGGYPQQGGNKAPDVPLCADGQKGNGFRYGQGWFWQNVGIDVQNRYSDALRIENYETVRVPLNGQGEAFERHQRLPTDDPAVVPNGGGNIVRFGFMFNASRFDDTKRSDVAQTPYMGWYVGDFRVLGERQLGNDLVIGNVTPKVGYDWRNIGVGPGTTVPVNVTVTNQGLFEIPGFEVRLDGHLITDAAQRITSIVATDKLPYRATLPPGTSRNFTLAFNVPQLSAGESLDRYIITASVVPFGLPDENDADNIASLGDVTKPIIAKVSRDVRVAVAAEPQAESSSVKRYLPIFVDNRGNVPAHDLVITRNISQLRGAQGPLLLAEDARLWVTTRPAPEGTRTLVSALADNVDVLGDLYWTAPAQANFLVQATLRDSVMNRLARTEVLVESHTTYLFDDAKNGLQGVAFRGDWDFADGWQRTDADGFGGSTGAYAFGDPALGAYPPDQNAALTLPTVDLSSASTAKLSFYQKYDFEEGYDGGLIEVSLDGGATWRPLQPDASVRQGLPLGYANATIAPGSPIDPANDPFNVTRAFTGSSRILPENLDGWILTQVNLGQIKDLVQQTNYEAFDAQTLRSDVLGRCAFDGPVCKADAYYADGSWLVGAAADYRYWEVNNLTEDRIKPSNATRGFLWSGSPRVDDDSAHPWNPMLNFPVDLTLVTSPDENVELTFREWMRHDAIAPDLLPDTGNASAGGVIRARASNSIHTYRSNWDNTYSVVERDGNWWTWAVDLSPYKGKVVNLSFSFQNVRFDDGTSKFVQLADAAAEWGWVLDDIKVTRYLDSGGLRKNETVVHDMDDVRQKSWARDCSEPSFSGAPCIAGSIPLVVRPLSARLPQALDGASAVSDGRYVYLFGGLTSSRQFSDAVTRFDPEDGTFTTLTERLPSGRTGTSAVWDGTAAYIVGGRGASGFLDEIVSFIPATETVTKLGTKLPRQIANTSAVWADSTALVFGGGNAAGPVSNIVRFTPGSAPVDMTQTLPTARQGTSAAWLNNAAYVVGGRESGSRTTQVLHVTLNGADVTVTHSRHLPAARNDTSTVAVGNAIYVLGGNASAPTNDIYTFTPGTAGTYTLDTKIGPGRARMASASVGSTSYFFGGDLGVAGESNEVLRLRTQPTHTTATTPGEAWSWVTGLPSTDVAWSILNLKAEEDFPYVKDMRDKLGAKELATGEPNRIWWSGAKAQDANGFADERPGANIPGGVDYRLVTPAIDLSRVAGDSAELKFNHMYAFRTDALPLQETNPVSQLYGEIGVVEVSVFDKDEGAWGDWEQLYKPGHALDRLGAGGQGGYPKAAPQEYRVVSTGLAEYAQLDLPSHEVESRGTDYVYGYMGRSSETDAPNFGWLEESFDLSEFVGKQVRLGFHTITMTRDPLARSTGNGAFPTSFFGGKGSGQGGWFLDDVNVIGETLAGQPVHLRFRAGTDGSGNCESAPETSRTGPPPACTGGWMIDDLSISGATYKRNVGIFLDDVPPGAGPGRGATFEGTLRNLADGVRRNLAVEVVDATLIDGSPPATRLAFDPLPVGGRGIARLNTDELHPSALIMGFNLAPRGANEFAFRVNVPDGATGDRRVVVRVVEYDPATDTFLPVTDNEVKGFANREFVFRINGTASLDFESLTATPKALARGATTTIALGVKNTGLVPVGVAATCSIRYIERHDPVNHKADEKEAVTYGPAVPCAPTPSTGPVAAHEERDIRFTFVPTRAGYYELEVAATYTNDIGDEFVLEFPGGAEIATRRILVDGQPLYLKDDLEDEDRLAEWKNVYNDALTNGNLWLGDDLRGRNGGVALRGGVSDKDFNTQGNPGYVNTATTRDGFRWSIVSPALDLHNVTEGPVYLRFWHLPRLAQFDGADVQARVLTNEFLPDTAWSPLQYPGGGNEHGMWNCRLQPVGGYDGPVYSYFARVGGGGGGPTGGGGTPGSNYAADVNAAFTGDDNAEGWWASNDTNAPPNRDRPVDYVEDQLYFTGFDTDWRLAEFELSAASCDMDNDIDNDNNMSLLGHTVQFVFNVWAGARDPVPGEIGCGDGACDAFSNRGRGQGWFIDDVHVSGYRLDFGPQGGYFWVKDNATKRLPTLVSNLGGYDDTVAVIADSKLSTLPLNNVLVSVDDAQLAPGEKTLAWSEVSLDRDPGLLPLLYNLRLLASSSVDTNVVRERVVTLDFSPRHWPDLRVTMEKPASTVQEGTRAYLPITIENYGLRAAPAPKVVVIETFNGQSKVHEIPAASLPEIPSFLEDPLASTVVTQFLWTPLPGRGVHHLEVVVDPDDAIAEYTKTDNRFALDVAVSKLLQPDLALAENGIALRVGGIKLDPQREGDVRRYQSQENELVTVEVAVRNDGPVGATNVDVRAFIGPLALPPKTLPFVPAGSEVVVPFTWLAQKGEWVLQFTARTDLVELDDANNRVPREGLIMLTVKGFDVATALSEITADVTPGSELKVDVILSNLGISGEEVRLKAVLPSGWQGTFDQSRVFLAKGRLGDNALKVPLRLQVGDRAVAGEQVITVQAIATENPLKVSVGTATVRVAAVFGATLKADAYATPPGRVDVPLKITNTGNSREAMTLKAALPAGWKLVGDAGEGVGVQVAPFVAETVMLAIETPTDAVRGVHDIDLSLALADGTTVNATLPLEVLRWRNVAFDLPAPTPTGPQDRLTYNVKLENTGNVAETFTLLTPSLPPGWFALFDPPRALLKPGDALQATLTVTPPADVAAGEYRLPVYAHFEGVQPASTEGLANRDELVLRVIKPDVAMEEFSFSPRLDVQPLTKVVVKGAVENVGTAVVKDLVVALYVDDVFMKQTVVPLLEVGARQEVELDWIAVGGEHSLLLVADPFEALLDANRENNAAARVIEVAGEPQKVGGVPAQTLKAPGFGGAFALLAVLGVALVVGRWPWRMKR